MNRDVGAAAIELVKEYGFPEALRHARSRAEACRDAGDVTGEVRWLRVALAIEELAGPKRNGGSGLAFGMFV